MASAPLRSLPAGLPWDPAFDPRHAELATKMAATAAKVDRDIQYVYLVAEASSPRKIMDLRHQIPSLYGSRGQRVVSVALASDQDLAAKRIALEAGKTAFKVGKIPDSQENIINRLKYVYQPSPFTCNIPEEARADCINRIIADAKAAKDEQGNYKCIQITMQDGMMFHLNPFSANPFMFAQFIPETCCLHVYKLGLGTLELEYMLPLPFDYLDPNPALPAPVQEPPAPQAQNRDERCVIL